MVQPNYNRSGPPSERAQRCVEALAFRARQRNAFTSVVFVRENGDYLTVVTSVRRLSMATAVVTYDMNDIVPITIDEVMRANGVPA